MEFLAFQWSQRYKNPREFAENNLMLFFVDLLNSASVELNAMLLWFQLAIIKKKLENDHSGSWYHTGQECGGVCWTQFSFMGF